MSGGDKSERKLELCQGPKLPIGTTTCMSILLSTLLTKTTVCLLYIFLIFILFAIFFFKVICIKLDHLGALVAGDFLSRLRSVTSIISDVIALMPYPEVQLG